MSDSFFEVGADTPASPWTVPMRAGNVGAKIVLMRNLMAAVVSAYESRYTVERCMEIKFDGDMEEAIFITANALSNALSVSERWLETTHTPDQEVPVDPMVAWVLESSRSLFVEFRTLVWVSSKFEKGQLYLGIQQVDAPEEDTN
jgi:hypothetical protein